MPCQWLKLEDGTIVHIRASRRRAALCEFCHRQPHTKLCDAPRGMTGTCDAKICDDCAVSTAPNVDICPHHAGRLEKMQGSLFETR